MRNYYGLRCRFRLRNRLLGVKVTSYCITRFALHLITACGRSCLAAARAGAVLGLPRRPIHCRAPASQPSRGSQSWNHAARLAEQTGFAPNTETFSAVYAISVSYRSRLARSPGGLGGRSRIEPRILISSLSAAAIRGSLAAQSPERSFFF